jgi:hypothetical protein
MENFLLIEHLVIFHPCKFNQLINIVSYTPRLLHLNCSTVEKTDDEIESNISFKLSNLTHLTIRIYYINFIEFEIFLLALCSRWKLFNVNILCKDESYLDADRVERFISHNMPLLKKFIFCYSDCMNDIEIKPNHALINRFTSPFWIRRKWIFQISLEKNEFIYSIEPYKYVQKVFIFSNFHRFFLIENLGPISKKFL